ncbi:ATP-dependent RecD-like DNA helicase, partial [Listeria monocytogenes]|nr:ATP-dependent RecD-like DNA helicase [Listeria monocytogenes]
LQLVNTPELNVFNGDMGEIVGITLAKDSEDKVDELVLQFDNNEVTYKRNEWNKITLSYCCSIHKAQGSEFRMVLLPMVHQYSRMLQRNLLYTAVTRSKELLILLGEVSAFETCVKNESASRMTMLKERIVNAEQMTLTTRTQLEAYEEGLTADHPFTEKETKAVSYETEQQSTKANQIKETDEQLVDTTVQEVSLFADEGEESTPETANKATKVVEEPLPKEPRLTVEIIQTNAVDPMIGMKDMTPYQFM